MFEAVKIRFSDIKVGDTAEFQTSVTLEMVDAFGQLSGDVNPLHMDESYASRTEFKGRVAHGMFAGIWFSRLIGMHLPGLGALYLSQNIRFHLPIMPGKSFVVHGEVIQKSDALQVITIATQVREQESGLVCADGQALVKVRGNL